MDHHHSRKKPPSLRDLARRLECSHSQLSEAVHRGTLTHGVAVDANGRAAVTDIDAAARQWNGHPAAKAAAAIVLTDHAMGCQVTALELFQQRDAYALLTTALVSAALDNATAGPLDGRKVAALRKRVAAQLHAVGELLGASADDIARAERDLEGTLEMLNEDEEEPEPEEKP